MFNSLEGNITNKELNRIYIKTGGLEWEISISCFTSNILPRAGATGKVFTYLYHREDKLKMYGFYSTAERDLFLELLKVESIGPALAMKILSGMQVDAFITALDTENITLLTTIPGLGKKTAQKIIFKLRGKLTAPHSRDPLVGDIVTALVSMGFDSKKAQDVVNSIILEINRETLDREELEKELIKLAISRLGNQ